MGFYSEYLIRKMSFPELESERKNMLRRISSLRENRDILVYASDLTKNAATSIDYTDLLPFQDQLSNLNGTAIDIILETPGGFAEVVEDLVKFVRSKYQKVGIIIPGYCKSAGTIFTMAGDEILMGPISALGPIDAQIINPNNKRFSAEALLEGLAKIKREISKTGRLNPAYIPILQNISPGEIQHCENAQKFSKKLVSKWLAEYKFKYWNIHQSTGKPVTTKHKKQRAEKIAKQLCRHSEWLTHGRSIKIKDFEKMDLKITDFSTNPDLYEAITRYYTLLRMSFDNTNLFKIFETIDSQIYRFTVGVPLPPQAQKSNEIAIIDFECPKCIIKHRLQANLDKHAEIQAGNLPFPIDNNIFICPNCGTESNITTIRIQIEAQSGRKIVK